MNPQKIHTKKYIHPASMVIYKFEYFMNDFKNIKIKVGKKKDCEADVEIYLLY